MDSEAASTGDRQPVQGTDAQSGLLASCQILLPAATYPNSLAASQAKARTFSQGGVAALLGPKWQGCVASYRHSEPAWGRPKACAEQALWTCVSAAQMSQFEKVWLD